MSRLLSDLRQQIHDFSASLGHRGRTLVWISLIYVLSGIYEITHVGLVHMANQGILVYSEIPPQFLGWMSIVAGVVAAMFARSGPTKDYDKIAWAALVIPAALRTGFLIWTCLVGLVTQNKVGNTDFWMVTLLSLFTVVVILQFSAWPEPKESPRSEDSQA